MKGVIRYEIDGDTQKWNGKIRAVLIDAKGIYRGEIEEIDKVGIRNMANCAAQYIINKGGLPFSAIIVDDTTMIQAWAKTRDGNNKDDGRTVIVNRRGEISHATI